MAYTAEIIKRGIVDGNLKVVVKYTDDSVDPVVSFNDSFITSQKQDDDWALKQIKKKLKELNTLKPMLNKIDLNVTITEDVVENPADPPTVPGTKAAYKKDLDDYQKMINAISRGVMEKTNPDFLALKQKLKDNFSIEYIDLF